MRLLLLGLLLLLRHIAELHAIVAIPLSVRRANTEVLGVGSLRLG